jgi:hypothetical protein
MSELSSPPGTPPSTPPLSPPLSPLLSLPPGAQSCSSQSLSRTLSSPPSPSVASSQLAKKRKVLSRPAPCGGTTHYSSSSSASSLHICDIFEHHTFIAKVQRLRRTDIVDAWCLLVSPRIPLCDRMSEFKYMFGPGVPTPNIVKKSAKFKRVNAKAFSTDRAKLISVGEISAPYKRGWALKTFKEGGDKWALTECERHTDADIQAMALLASTEADMKKYLKVRKHFTRPGKRLLVRSSNGHTKTRRVPIGVGSFQNVKNKFADSIRGTTEERLAYPLDEDILTAPLRGARVLVNDVLVRPNQVFTITCITLSSLRKLKLDCGTHKLTQHTHLHNTHTHTHTHLHNTHSHIHVSQVSTLTTRATVKMIPTSMVAMKTV